MSSVFEFFQIYLKRFVDPVVDNFVENLQVLSLGNGNDFNHRNKRRTLKSTEKLIISGTLIIFNLNNYRRFFHMYTNEF